MDGWQGLIPSCAPYLVWVGHFFHDLQSHWSLGPWGQGVPYKMYMLKHSDVEVPFYFYIKVYMKGTLYPLGDHKNRSKSPFPCPTDSWLCQCLARKWSFQNWVCTSWPFIKLRRLIWEFKHYAQQEPLVWVLDKGLSSFPEKDQWYANGASPILNAMYLFSQGLGEYTIEAEKQDDEEYHISIWLPKGKLEFSLFWTHEVFLRAPSNPKALCPQSLEIRSALDVTVKAREDFGLERLEEAPPLSVSQWGCSDRHAWKMFFSIQRDAQIKESDIVKEVVGVGLGWPVIWTDWLSGSSIHVMGSAVFPVPRSCGYANFNISECDWTGDIITLKEVIKVNCDN